MRLFPLLLLCLLPALPLGAEGDATAAAEDTRPLPSRWEVEEMYARARTMLEVKDIRDVSEVPRLLEECVRAGFIPAERLLQDVYEGRFKGLAAQPEKAAGLTLARASSPPAPGDAAMESLRAEAMFRYALYCERGFGRKAAPAEAFQWMQKAARMGFPHARVELARYLMRGKGHKAAPRRALRLLLEEQERNPDTPNLYFYLGTLCAQGRGLEHERPNWRMALRYFERGAEHRDARATNNLGAMYERGIVVTRDTAHALRLYKRAADLGSKEASANWQRLAYKSGLRSDAPAETTMGERLDNAKLRVIEALPVSPATRQKLSAPIRRRAAQRQMP